MRPSTGPWFESARNVVASRTPTGPTTSSSAYLKSPEVDVSDVSRRASVGAHRDRPGRRGDRAAPDQELAQQPDDPDLLDALARRAARRLGARMRSRPPAGSSPSTPTAIAGICSPRSPATTSTVSRRPSRTQRPLSAPRPTSRTPTPYTPRRSVASGKPARAPLEAAERAIELAPDDPRRLLSPPGASSSTTGNGSRPRSWYRKRSRDRSERPRRQLEPRHMSRARGKLAPRLRRTRTHSSASTRPTTTRASRSTASSTRRSSTCSGSPLVLLWVAGRVKGICRCPLPGFPIRICERLRGDRRLLARREADAVDAVGRYLRQLPRHDPWIGIPRRLSPPRLLALPLVLVLPLRAATVAYQIGIPLSPGS